MGKSNEKKVFAVAVACLLGWGGVGSCKEDAPAQQHKQQQQQRKRKRKQRRQRRAEEEKSFFFFPGFWKVDGDDRDSRTVRSTAHVPLYGGVRGVEKLGMCRCDCMRCDLVS